MSALPHRLAAPLIEESAGPGGRVVIPELLERLLEQVSADGFQIVAQQIATEVLLVAEILTSFDVVRRRGCGQKLKVLPLRVVARVNRASISIAFLLTNK